MKQHPVRPQRRSIRLKNYNYSQGGSYFVTVCTNDHRCILGSINNGVLQFTSFGKIVQDFWLAIPLHFRNVTLDESVVMPNHFHGILTLANIFAGAACCAPTKNLNTNPLQRTAKPPPESLPTIIRSFKAVVTRQINELQNTRGSHFWQRGYYEHVIRGEKELNRIRKYIHNNPLKWELDRENPDSRNFKLHHDLYWKNVYKKRRANS